MSLSPCWIGSQFLGKWRLEAPRTYMDYDIKTKYKSNQAIISRNEATPRDFAFNDPLMRLKWDTYLKHILMV